jgi:hypothetical protein
MCCVCLNVHGKLRNTNDVGIIDNLARWIGDKEWKGGKEEGRLLIILLVMIYNHILQFLRRN